MFIQIESLKGVLFEIFRLLGGGTTLSVLRPPTSGGVKYLGRSITLFCPDFNLRPEENLIFAGFPLNEYAGKAPAYERLSKNEWFVRLEAAH